MTEQAINGIAWAVFATIVLFAIVVGAYWLGRQHGYSAAVREVHPEAFRH